MGINNQNSFLELEIVWKDEHMFELKVTASNGRYTGTTEVYDTSEALTAFAKSLLGYSSNSEMLVHETGKKDGYAYFAMLFYPFNSFGYIGLLINMEENAATDYRENEKDKLKLEIIVEPSAIDNFQRQLLRLATEQNGKATLYGRKN
jgi:hypothetical protein